MVNRYKNPSWNLLATVKILERGDCALLISERVHDRLPRNTEYSLRMLFEKANRVYYSVLKIGAKRTQRIRRVLVVDVDLGTRR